MRSLTWLTIFACVGTCGWAGHRYWIARTDASVSLRQLQRVSADVSEIASLRSAALPESRRHRPPPGLAARVADVVVGTGVPQAVLQNVSPETESLVGGTGLHRATAKLTLEPLTLPQLGRFLQEWRSAEPAWTVASIEITPAPQRGSKGQERQLRAILGIESVFGTEPAKEGSR